MRTTYLIFVLVVLSIPSFPLPQPPHLLVRFVTLFLGMGFVLLSAEYIALRTMRQLARNQRNLIAPLQWFSKWKGRHRIFRAIMFVFFAIFLGWNNIVRQEFGLGSWIAIDDLIILLPFMLIEIISTAIFHQVDLTIDQTIERRSGVAAAPIPHEEKLWVQLRTEHGPWMLIALVVLTIHDVIDWFNFAETNQAMLAVASMGAMIVISLIVLPLAIRMALPLRSMPRGNVRDELEAWATHEKIRFSDILIWRTRHSLANAAVTGILPQLRYIFISETILHQLSPLEVIGVFGHEVGHVRHRHLLKFFVFVLTSLVMLILVGAGIERWMVQQWRLNESLFLIPLYLWLAVPYFYFTLGYFSRRFERQADIAGCRATASFVPDPASSMLDESSVAESITIRMREGTLLFLGAMRKVTLINGMDGSHWSWRQGRLSDRLRFLEQLAISPEKATVFNTSTNRQFLLSLAAIVVISLVAYLILSL
ncbi:M48 family metalloprotease [bacterium]|nr:M48 family metalloprotease [bacterium]